MQRMPRLPLAGVVALLLTATGVPDPASAGTLTLTGSTLSVAIGGLPAIGTKQGAPVPIFVSSGGGSFVEPPGVFATSLSLVPQLFTGVSLISGIKLVASHGTQTLGAGRGQNAGFGGPGPLSGNVFVNILDLFNLTIPLAIVGAGGTVMASGPGVLQVTVTGNLWTTGTVVVSSVTITPTGNTVTATGFDERTPGHAGTLLLVSPIRVVTNAAGTLPGFAFQRLTFVPEPGSLICLAGALLLLAGLARTGPG